MPHATERPEEPAPATPGPGLPARRPARPPTRRLASGLLVALVGMPVLTAILTGLGSRVDLPTALLLYLLLVVVVAVVGGFVPAAVTAVGTFLLANWYFTPPFHRFGIAKQADLLALVVFIAVAGVVSALVDLRPAGQRRRPGPAPRPRRWLAWAARCCTARTRCPSWWSSSG
jgi:two-component system sensor histidine kinase KdpD